ncbi:MAG: hypothetical protein KC964_10400, partial [Candidatus Omnitrophica bacterium]|nr:hypothetical protein [Candidatus Omnitrophota bacterium]
QNSPILQTQKLKTQGCPGDSPYFNAGMAGSTSALSLHHRSILKHPLGCGGHGSGLGTASSNP